jgi:hypothetical protein
MLKKLFGLMLVLALLAPVTGNAMDMTGKVGCGFYNSMAPIGVRYWLNDKLGADLGIGFISDDDGNETTTTLSFEVGFPYIMYPSERANLFIRPGLLFSSTDYPAPVDKRTELTLSLSPGVEVFFGDRFSLEASHGLEINLISPSAGENQTDFMTTASSIVDLGFHFYFK